MQKIIIDLAQKYNSPAFQPHCTLVGKTDISLLCLKSVVIEMADKFNMTELHPWNIGYTENIWQALYIEIEESQKLEYWHRKFCNILCIKPKKNYFPHISLMYSALSLNDKMKLISTLEIESTYDIYSLQITDCTGEVSEWKSLFEKRI